LDALTVDELEDDDVEGERRDFLVFFVFFFLVFFDPCVR
jgi:hypothetical protein